MELHQFSENEVLYFVQLVFGFFSPLAKLVCFSLFCPDSPSYQLFTAEVKLQLIQSTAFTALQELSSDPSTDRRLVMAAEKVIDTLHSN